jgi:hypothetical protein
LLSIVNAANSDIGVLPKVTAIETFNKLALLIDDCDCRLYQLSIDTHHVILCEDGGADYGCK